MHDRPFRWPDGAPPRAPWDLQTRQGQLVSAGRCDRIVNIDVEAHRVAIDGAEWKRSAAARVLVHPAHDLEEPRLSPLELLPADLRRFAACCGEDTSSFR